MSRTAPLGLLGSQIGLGALVLVSVVGCSQASSATAEAGPGGSGSAGSGSVNGGAGGTSGTFAASGSPGTIGEQGGTTGSGGAIASAGTSGESAAPGGGGQSAGSGGAHSAGSAGAQSAGSGGAQSAGSAGAHSAGSAGVPAGGAGGAAASPGPCDIYLTGNVPCVAAHSTVRALYGSYNGKLYQVRRASDKTTKDIGVLMPGGFADSAAQDAFCSGTTCTISIIYDQSPKGNHLTSAPAGGAKNSPDSEASATALKLTIAGHAVYAIYVTAGIGYRQNKTLGIATADQPETEYMVTSGKHYNNGCCFDYGNAETNNLDDGAGTMEAVYFGNSTSWGKGAGAGPWVMADLENGLFAGPSFAVSSNNTPLSSDYVTAIVKGKAGGFALKGADAQAGVLKTMYEGARPTMAGYDPMKKQGAIILGIGGDNSNSAIGTFFEGCMTTGYASDATDDAIQANIVAAGYGR